MAVVHEAIAFGFVKSLARPGRNITGLACQTSPSVLLRADEVIQ
jgi:ABC-type uncharacterized transport system substrate-binding protein